MKRMRPVISGVVAVLLFGAGFAAILLSGRGDSRGSAASYVVDGFIEADEADVASKLPGRVESLLAREGDYVEAGQTLAILSSEEIDAKAEQALAGLRAAEATYEKGRIAAELEQQSVESKIKQAAAGLKAARAALGMASEKLAALESGARPQELEMAAQAVAAAEAVYDTATKTWNRVRSLAGEGVLAAQKADEVEMKYREATAQLTAARQRHDMVRQGARIEEVEAARHQVRQAEAGVEAAELTLQLAKDARLMVDIRNKDVDAARQGVAAGEGVFNEASAYKRNTKIVSPITGRINKRMVNEGEIVAPGYAMMTVTASRGFRVDVYVDESKFSGVKMGDSVKVEIPAAGRTLDGKVSQIMPMAEFATRRATNENGGFDERALRLRIDIADAPADLVAGMTARVAFNH